MGPEPLKIALCGRILGYEEVTRNLVVRSRISQSLAWQVTKYNSQRKLSDKLEFDRSPEQFGIGAESDTQNAWR